MKRLLALGSVLIGLFCAVALFHAATLEVDVSPGNLEGWTARPSTI
jgi:hypothetical protein